MLFITKNIKVATMFSEPLLNEGLKEFDTHLYVKLLNSAHSL